MSSSVDRMSGVILARSIFDRRELLKMSGEIDREVARLASYKLFSVGEIAEIAGMSEYRVRKTTPPNKLLRAKSGVKPRHLEHLLRMIDNPLFSKLQVKYLVGDGATLAALARITGQSETSLRRWSREE